MSEDEKDPGSPGLQIGKEPIRASGIEALRLELEELEGAGRNEVARRIKSARELGDLKENAEYHIAKNDQAHLETRIKRLRDRLRNAVVVEADRSANVFSFGRTAEVRDMQSGQLSTWTLVGAAEADPQQGRLSAESPAGRALRDAPVGEEVEFETPGGAKLYRIESLLE